MDPRSVAHLDRKTGKKVLCGSCGNQLAHVDDMNNFEDLSGNIVQSKVRFLCLDYGWQPRTDGIWVLTKRAAHRAKQGKYPSVRRQWKAIMQAIEDDLSPPDHKDERFASLPKTESGFRLVRLVARLPIRVQCNICGSVQYFEASALRVQPSTVLPHRRGLAEVTDTGRMMTRTWLPREYWKQMPPDNLLEQDDDMDMDDQGYFRSANTGKYCIQLPDGSWTLADKPNDT